MNNEPVIAPVDRSWGRIPEPLTEAAGTEDAGTPPRPRSIMRRRALGAASPPRRDPDDRVHLLCEGDAYRIRRETARAEVAWVKNWLCPAFMSTQNSNNSIGGNGNGNNDGSNGQTMQGMGAAWRIRRGRLMAIASLLLISCTMQTSSFSFRPASSVVRWQPPLHNGRSTTSSSSLSSKPKNSMAAAATSTEEKISQLEEHQTNQRQKRGLNSISNSSINSSSNKSDNNNINNDNGNNSKSYGRNKRYGRTRGGRVADRCSRAQNDKRRVRYLYSKARSLEKRGAWGEASELLERILELEPRDAHSYLALARLEGRRERGSRTSRDEGGGSAEAAAVDDAAAERAPSAARPEEEKKFGSAREIFEVGTAHCPSSVHLHQAWAVHERSLGNVARARELFDKALELDPWNGYVCHAYGLMELQQERQKRQQQRQQQQHDQQGQEQSQQQQQRQQQHGIEAGNADGFQKARRLWQRGLTYQPSAALVCSLGELYISSGHPNSARELYSTYAHKMTDERERVEVYLAASSLEETVYNDVGRASKLLKEALASGDARDGRPYVALARLGTSGGAADDAIVKKRLKEICTKQLKRRTKAGGAGRGGGRGGGFVFPVNDGRLFNAWAKLESKSNLSEARRILSRGMRTYPRDHALIQAAGSVEERLGNVSAARDLYGASLHRKPSAPALIAYAMLELKAPQDPEKGANVTAARKLMDEALLLDPKHGPAYNAYGNLERRAGNPERAKRLYADGINANCTDAPSVYHGLARLHLSLGEVEEARDVLRRGLEPYRTGGDEDAAGGGGGARAAVPPQSQNDNVAFLAHTLAVLELNVYNSPAAARSALRLGLNRSPNSPQLLLARATCEVRCGNDDEARKWFERSIESDPKHAQAWRAYGVAEMGAGNLWTARTLFECGLKESPGHGPLWQSYGTLESWKGNVGKARLLFAAGIQKCPSHVPLYHAWARLELRSGDVGTARRLVGEALTRDKRDGKGWLVAANVEEKAGNRGLVGLILRRGIECAPGDVELYRALAEHEVGRGRIDSARELLERGIEMNPLHAPLYHSLAELEARVFNLEGLARLNRRTAEIFPSDAAAASSTSTSQGPSSLSASQTQAWSRKIRQGGRPARVPDGIAALAERIGVAEGDASDIAEAGGPLDDVDPESLLEGMGGLGDEYDDFVVRDGIE